MGPQPRIQLNRLNNDVDFESLLRDICALEWNNPDVEKFGRRGQKQFGVDVYGQPDGLQGIYWGVQCKHRATQKQLTRDEILTEIKSAQSFPHRLGKLIVATDLPIDRNTQVLVDNLNDDLDLPFKVTIWFWDRLERQVTAYPRLLSEYYSDLILRLTNNNFFARLVDVPLKILLPDLSSQSQEENGELISILQFHGIQIVTPAQTVNVNDDEFDGILLDCRLSFDVTKLVAIYLRYVQMSMPIFIVANNQTWNELQNQLESFGMGTDRLSLFFDVNNHEIAARIFSDVFQFGYSRRGNLSTVNILARSLPGTSSALLDMDWTRIKGDGYPSLENWEELYQPTIRNVAVQLASCGNQTVVQIDSRLPIPASVALGFALNTRLVNLSVWCRVVGRNDFREQYWSANTRVASELDIELIPRQEIISGTSAILEISSGPSIHAQVSDFASQIQLQVSQWFSIELQRSSGDSFNIDEECAMLITEAVSRFIRDLNSKNITDIHLFMRIPSALAILIGNRLQGCGRLHLYWHTNPGYQKAFTLR